MTSHAPVSTIAQILADPNRLADSVCLHLGCAVDKQQLIDDVKRISQTAQQSQCQHWALYCDDSYLFCIAFLALVNAGKVVIILPNLQSDFIAATAHEYDALLTDQKTPAATNLEHFHVESLRKASPGSDQCLRDNLDSSQQQISLFTSGTSGQPNRIDKKLCHLENEVLELETMMGHQLEQSTIISTVSHQHIYGFLFRILWPLCTQRRFDTTMLRYPEQLLTCMDRPSTFALISSPAFLKRVANTDPLRIVKDKFSALFSSGGPLPQETAVQLYKTLGIAVTEIYGSSETGGIAHRQQIAVNDAPWETFPSVEVRQHPSTDVLMVRSPFIHESLYSDIGIDDTDTTHGATQWFVMGDIAKIDSQSRFQLQGRADAIVKIEEKRVSLLEIENRLRDSALVSDCVALALTKPRQRIAVVAVLTPSGQDILDTQGKAALNNTLKQALASYFEAVVLPKKWRFVMQIPLNSQGKIQRGQLLNLFDDKQATTSEPDLKQIIAPDIGISQSSANTARLELSIPDTLRYFEGHFTGKPILPGVVQIDWAIKYALQLFSINGSFSKMEKIKFHDFILPKDNLCLNLSYREEKQTLSFSFESQKGKHSSGQIFFE